MKKELIEQMLSLYGKKDIVEVFADNGRYYSQDDRNLLLFDHDGQVLYSLQTDNTYKNNKTMGISLMEYEHIQFLDASLSRVDALALLDGNNQISNLMTDEEKVLAKIGYDLVSRQQKIDLLETLTLEENIKARYKIIYKIFKNVKEANTELNRLLDEDLITEEQYNDLKKSVQEKLS